MEIERKFLVKTFPQEAQGCASCAIEQGYLSLTPEVRIRRRGDCFFQTEKSAGTLVREEREWEISETEYREKVATTVGAIVHKTRYEIPLGAYTAELDVYHGALDGLLTVEVEFPSVAESAAFVPPLWFGREVTDDPAYRNRILAMKGFPKIR